MGQIAEGLESGPCASGLKARSRNIQIYEGTNQVQRVVMAKQLLAGVQSTL